MFKKIMALVVLAAMLSGCTNTTSEGAPDTGISEGETQSAVESESKPVTDYEPALSDSEKKIISDYQSSIEVNADPELLSLDRYNPILFPEFKNATDTVEQRGFKFEFDFDNLTIIDVNDPDSLLRSYHYDGTSKVIRIPARVTNLSCTDKASGTANPYDMVRNYEGEELGTTCWAIVSSDMGCGVLSSDTISGDNLYCTTYMRALSDTGIDLSKFENGYPLSVGEARTGAIYIRLEDKEESGRYVLSISDGTEFIADMEYKDVEFVIPAE